MQLAYWRIPKIVSHTSEPLGVYIYVGNLSNGI